MKDEDVSALTGELLMMACGYAKGMLARFPEPAQQEMAIKAAMSGATIFAVGLGLQNLDDSAPDATRELMRFLHDLLDHSLPAARQMLPATLKALEERPQEIIVDTDDEGLVTIELALPANHLTLTPSEANVLIDSLIKHTAVVQ